MPQLKSTANLRANAGGRKGHGAAVSTALARNLRVDTLARLLEALKNQWKRYRKRLRECQKEFSEPAVHDSRVETRRLLSMLELLEPFLGRPCLEPARRTLKRHLNTFDDLRDTHVQLLAVARLRRQVPAAPLFEEYLLKREKRFTRRTRKDVRRIETKRLGKLIADWHEQVARLHSEGASRNTNSRLLNGLRTAFHSTARLQARIDPADTGTIHRTRVAFKKFRYMVEIVTDLVPSSHKRLLARMHHYQALMGDIQDAEVLLEGFDKFLRRKGLQPEAATRFRQELLRRREALTGRYLLHSAELLAFSPTSEGPAKHDSRSPYSARREPATVPSKPPPAEKDTKAKPTL